MINIYVGTISKSADLFIASKEEVLTAIHAIRSKQKERNEKIQKMGRNVESLKLTAQIRGKLPELEKLLDKMNIALRAQIKDPKVKSINDTK